MIPAEGAQGQHRHVYRVHIFSEEFCDKLRDEVSAIHEEIPQLHFDERGLFLSNFGFEPLFEKVGQQLTKLFVQVR